MNSHMNQKCNGRLSQLIQKFLTAIVTIHLFLAPIVLAGNSAKQNFRKCPGSDKQCPQIVDENLKKCIVQKAKKPIESLSDKDFLHLTSLHCSNMSITTLVGIENLTKLTELELNQNQISDLAPVASLNNLTILYISNNGISDISHLASLTQIKELHLEDNLIENISPLQKLTRLEILLLENNAIHDINPLQDLKNLVWLDLSNNQISEISPLGNLTKLENLYISENAISDVSILQELQGLKRLLLNKNDIYDIKPLSGFPLLERLGLDNNYIVDISTLNDLPKLLLLRLQSNQISKISPLTNLPGLKRLMLNSNLIKDISPLVNLPLLEGLYLDDNIIIDITPLKDLPKLKDLSLGENSIINFKPIEHVPNVTVKKNQHRQLWQISQLAIKRDAQLWLTKQTEKNCVEVGKNEYSLRHEHGYFADGIYGKYNVNDEQGEQVREFTCRFAWNSDLDYILFPLEKSKKQPNDYDEYSYSDSIIYAKDGKLKGLSRKLSAPEGSSNNIEAFGSTFNVQYDIKKTKVQGKAALVAEKMDHVIVEIMGDPSTLQFFDKKFYDEVIKSQK